MCNAGGMFKCVMETIRNRLDKFSLYTVIRYTYITRYTLNITQNLLKK